MSTKLTSIFFGIVFCTATVQAQITIGGKSSLAAKGEISANASFSNASSLVDFSAAQLFLTGTNQSLSTAEPLTFLALTVDGGGNKTIKGEWTISRELSFVRGILSSGAGKLTYTGVTTLNGSTNSFVDGTLYQRGTGVLFFPIGVADTYLPMSLNDVRDGAAEIGVTGFTAGANLTLPADLTSITTNRYWELSGSPGSSSASLYVPGSSVDGLPGLVVVQADNANNATAISLRGGITGDFVTSFSPVTKPILTIGVGEKVDLQIHDLISPFTADGYNDRLQIVNVDMTGDNKVTLLDRWGVVVKEWKNFRNDDESFDFSKLSPGNYICVLEYQLTSDSPKEKLSQMITILKR
ncbi:MAG: gliding motility-associated C-terminal domain-containing protein [Cyclobacteriaceae bacterium]|nr:gliding motility-associated C-terminal domain-containing protein [Cyclobacteriaceae bacterium]